MAFRKKKKQKEDFDYEAFLAEPPAKKKKGHRFLRILISLILLMGIYIGACYTSIPFIAKWRSIYIQTAMTTTDHKWLATLFIPGSVVDDVMDEMTAMLEEQEKMTSTWGKDGKSQGSGSLVEGEAYDEEGNLIQGEAYEEKSEDEIFFDKYWEINSPSVRTYFSEHPELTADGYDNIWIEDFDEELGLTTVKGDTILVINAPNNLLIIETDGKSYKGKLAIAKDPSQVNLTLAKNLGSKGDKIKTFCDDNNAILGINASGFQDPNGNGSGGEVKGSMIVDGVEYGRHKGDAGWRFIGMSKDNLMYVSSYEDIKNSDFRWGIEFYPGLIVDGKEAVNEGYCMGIQPRTTIGQEQDGSMLMLVIDGRQPGYSLGCSVAECTQIMLRYDAYQGSNVDGGSSAVMYYDGRQITKASSVSGKGRYMPDCFLVSRLADKTE